MCLSAEVDFAAGLAITAIGVDALRHVRRVEDVPFASLPLVLGAHQWCVWAAVLSRAPAFNTRHEHYQLAI